MDLGIGIIGGFALGFGILSIYMLYRYMKIQNSMDALKRLNEAELAAAKDTNLELSTNVGLLSTELNEMTIQRDEVVDKLNKTVHQKKSSEVKLGKIGENLAPFTDGWPWDSNNFRFIGSPIDGIQFTDDMVYFVEIKTGNSRLSKYQTVCKKLIEEGKVSFVTFRIGADGIELKTFPMKEIDND